MRPRLLPFLWCVVGLGVTLGWNGCVEPSLGTSPFLCNNGQPECPEGYVCQQHGKVKVCVLPGTQPNLDTASKPPDIAIVPDTHRPPDQPIVQLDKPMPDGTVVKWDKGPPDLAKDKGPTPDAGPHLGCQSNAECTTTDSPCCCPVPLLPLVWACLPICLNPFCL
jgi:hypothetical protein